MATAGESYALGGWNSVPATAKEVYDPGSGTWATLAPLPANRTDLAVVWSDDDLLVVDKPAGMVIMERAVQKA